MNEITSAPSDLPGPCPDCGLLYKRGYAPDERYHRSVHDEAVNGPKAKLVDGFYAVTHSSLMPLQMLAQRAASAARYATQYDFPSFAADKKRNDEFDTIAMIRIISGRTCGLVVTRNRPCKYTAHLSAFRVDGMNSWRPIRFTEVELHQRRAVEMIWVLKSKRGLGVAKDLVEALAQHCNSEVEALAHMIPFSKDALRFWRNRGLSTIYVV